MCVFTANKRRFVVHLRPEADVAEALRQDSGPATTQEQVENALTSLEERGNLRASLDEKRKALGKLGIPSADGVMHGGASAVGC